jgi:uncharacterized repeat protein (TIGR01451 family)
VRHSSSVTRPTPRRTAVLGLLATFVALLTCGVAAADTVTTNFEAPVPPNPQAPFQLGSVNGQDGWKSDVPGDIPSLPNGYDQAVVANSGAPPAFGGQSLRISNAYGTGPDTFPPEYELQTYSKPTANAAGDSLGNTEYTAQFSFISFHPDRQQPRLRISLSPDNGHGGRMSYIGLDDMADGIHVIFYDTPNPDGDFAAYDLRTLPRNVPHTIKFWMKLNPGPDNDLVRIFIDGQDVGQCFTTWENFYRATKQAVPISDRLLFLSGNRDGDRLTLLGGGYLFDSVTTTTANGKGPAGCDTPIDKQADTATVRAGGLAGYQITVRNRGRTVARNLRVCDHIPRRMTFVRADRKLARLGRARCLLILRLAPGQRVSFHVDLRVDATAPPGTETNIADVTPVEPPTSVEVPPGDLPGPSATTPGAQAPVTTASVPVKKARALIKVLARRARPHRPNFTG